MPIRRRIDEITRKIIKHTGYDNGAFNIEFFYDQRLNKIWLLEINPRISQSHSDLFFKVDGAPNQKVIIELATGRAPELPRRQGDYKTAAKFYLREFRDGIVSRVLRGRLSRRWKMNFPAQ